MRYLRFHHNELNFQRGILQDDWSLEDIHESEDMRNLEDVEKQEKTSTHNRANIRRHIDDFLENKRKRDEDADPFDDDYYYDDES